MSSKISTDLARSLKCWWTLADLKIAEQVGLFAYNGESCHCRTMLQAEDGSSDASSSFGDEPPESHLFAVSLRSLRISHFALEKPLRFTY